MRMIDIILKKKAGEALEKREIDYVVEGCCRGSIPDYQLSALLMAICFQGMTPEETAHLTNAMLRSGDVIDQSRIPGIKVDKHSTGGVADTTTLILAPLVAACGAPVAKISGRGLGHTGGTLDKLESVPGLSVNMTVDDFVAAVCEHGIAVMGQTENLVPADKKLYALRDVTGTVDSIPLIASSIMSKKFASGSDAIVLDVKTGNGAFMDTVESAERLTKEMVQLGKAMKRQVVAFVTDMNQPLGSAVGNALELYEAILALKGGMSLDAPLMLVTLAIGEQMLLLAGTAQNGAHARSMLKKAVEDGSGLEKLRQLLRDLGGSDECCDRPEILLRARRKVNVTAETAGYVVGMDTVHIGEAAMLLGAGRSKKEEEIDHDVGLVMKVRIGDRVEIGQMLAELHVNDEKNLQSAIAYLKGAVKIGAEKPEPVKLIYSMIR